MSTLRLGSAFNLPDDPRQVELVQSLFVKSREGKIPWTKQGNAFTASLPDGLQANFVLAPTLSMVGPTENWQLFTVRDKRENELLRVHNPPRILALLSGQGKRDPLVEATDDLFRAVQGTAGDDLTRAIDVIKKL